MTHTEVMKVQCTAPSGKRGTFIVANSDSDEPVSPVFDDLVYLFHWMREHGWQQDSTRTWGVKKI